MEKGGSFFLLRRVTLTDISEYSSPGSGTIRIIDACKESGPPEPEPAENSRGFLVTLFKNMLTDERLKKMGLNERQIRAASFVKENGRITGRTALRDTDGQISLNVLKRRGGEGKNTYYSL